MFRRALVFAVCLLSFIPVVAHADTITFTPSTGTSVYSLNLGAMPDAYQSNNGQDAATYYANNRTITLYLYNQAYSNSLNAQGYGAVDAQLVDSNSGLAWLLTGPVLYSGTGNNLKFLAGTYNVGSSPRAGVQGGGTITITAQTPEPTSLALLSTGLLSIAGVASRRFFKAATLAT